MRKYQIRRRRTSMKTTEVVIKIIEFFGSQRNWARHHNLTQPAIHAWVKKGRVPWRYAKEIERLTKRKITRQEIRPDIFK